MSEYPRTQVLWALEVEIRHDGYYFSTNGGDWHGPYVDLREMVEKDLGRELYIHLETFCGVFLRGKPPTQQ